MISSQTASHSGSRLPYCFEVKRLRILCQYCLASFSASILQADLYELPVMFLFGLMHNQFRYLFIVNFCFTPPMPSVVITKITFAGVPSSIFASLLSDIGNESAYITSVALSHSPRHNTFFSSVRFRISLIAQHHICRQQHCC